MNKIRSINLILVLIVFLLLFSAVVSCSSDSGETITDATSGKDTKSPVLLSVNSESESLVRLAFDEPVVPYGTSFGENEVYTDGSDILVSLKTELPAGESREISGRVCDLYGNSTGVSVKAWGFNRNPAKAIFNEFTTAGSGKNPDRTEILITSGGSVTGMTVYDGIPGDTRSSVILKDLNVASGNFIVIWWTESLPEGVSEHPSENVWNVCSYSDDLSQNNGILTLTASPSEGASVVDCIAYSTGESSSNEGWGTKDVLQRYKTAVSKGWLKHDVINPKGSTATKSVSRDSQGIWHITQTGGATFGFSNN